MTRKPTFFASLRPLNPCVLALVAGLITIGAGDVGARDPIAEEVDESIPPEESEPEDCPTSEVKVVIGATADFVEKESGFKYTGRVDTGATTCSIHADKVRVEDVHKSMLKNIGKKVSFVLVSPDGKKSKRVTSTIADTVRVKTSDGMERRYKVWLTLQHAGVERRVHVTLNDRSHMEYPLLIGRNFLCGKFLVDVEYKNTKETIAAREKAGQGDKESKGS